MEKPKIILYNQKLKQPARNLRSHSTLSEVTLWCNLLRGRQLKGYQFLRQKPVANYIADFLCKELKLIIELDGLTHEGKQYQDRMRQNKLHRLGFEMLRFDDTEVIEDFERVRKRVTDWIENYEARNGGVMEFKRRRKRKGKE